MTKKTLIFFWMICAGFPLAARGEAIRAENSAVTAIKTYAETLVKEEKWDELWELLSRAEDKLLNGKMDSNAMVVEKNGTVARSFQTWIDQQKISLLKTPAFKSRALFLKQYEDKLKESIQSLKDYFHLLIHSGKTTPRHLKKAWERAAEDFLFDSGMLKELSEESVAAFIRKHVYDSEEKWQKKMNGFTTGYLENERYLLPLPIREESYFNLIATPLERYTYTAGLAEVIYAAEQSCKGALFFWEKALQQFKKLKRVSNQEWAELKSLGWHKEGLLAHLNSCHQKLEFALSQELSQEKAIYFLGTHAFRKRDHGMAHYRFPDSHEPFYSVELGNRLFIVSRRDHEVYLFIFDQKTGALLKNLFLYEMDKVDETESFEFFLAESFEFFLTETALRISDDDWAALIHPHTLDLLQVFQDAGDLEQIKNELFLRNSGRPLATVLSDETLFKWFWGVGADGLIREEQAWASLAEILPKDAHIAVKVAAVRILRKIKNSAAALSLTQRLISSLIETLKEHKEVGRRQMAAWALGEIGDQTAVAPLQEAFLNDANFDIREAAYEALLKIGAPPKKRY